MSINKFAKQNQASFGHIQYIQVNRMNNCTINNVNKYIYFANDKKIPEHINNILNKCKKSVSKLLDDWKGIKKSKKQMSTFRAYFSIAKNSFDQSKIRIIAKEFWCPIFDIINQVAKSSSHEFFCGAMWNHQKQYTLYLKQLIFKELIIGKLKLPNTRANWLIPISIYPILRIQDEFALMKLPSNIKGGKLRSFMLEWMNKQYDESQYNYVVNLINLHAEVDQYSAENINNTKTSKDKQVQPLMMPLMNEHCEYCCCRGQNCFTKELVRYNPY